MTDPTPVPFIELLRNARSELESQFGQEAKLLQAEAKAKASSLVTAVALGAGGAVVSLFSMGVAVQALVYFIISLGISPMSASLLVAFAFALLATAMVMAAKSILKNWTPVPLRTLAAIKEDFAALRKAVSHVSS